MDLSDLTILANNYGQSGKTWLQGDFNGDGDVDISDLTLMANSYGKAGSSLQPVQIQRAVVSEAVVAGPVLAAQAVYSVAAGQDRLPPDQPAAGENAEEGSPPLVAPAAPRKPFGAKAAPAERSLLGVFKAKGRRPLSLTWDHDGLRTLA